MPGQRAIAALTSEEWNAAYFLGLESIFRRDCECNVPEQVLEGARILAAAGYRFHRFDPDGEQAVDGHRTRARTQGRPCAEIASGSFDMIPRARATVSWLHAHVPSLSTRWLTGLIGTYDQLHSELAQDAAPGDAPAAQPSPRPGRFEGAADG